MSGELYRNPDGSFPTNSGGEPVAVDENAFRDLCCGWQGWRQYEALGECSASGWTGKDWAATASGIAEGEAIAVEGTDWGTVFVGGCDDVEEEPGTITGGTAVQCNPDNSEDVAYEVGSVVKVWGPRRGGTVAKTEANIWEDAPTAEITGLLCWLLYYAFTREICGSAGDEPDGNTEYELDGAAVYNYDCQPPPEAYSTYECETYDGDEPGDPGLNVLLHILAVGYVGPLCEYPSGPEQYVEESELDVTARSLKKCGNAAASDPDPNFGSWFRYCPDEESGNWQGWQEFEAKGTCTDGEWETEWEATGSWGWQFGAPGEDHVEEPGTIEGGDTVCDPLHYQVGTKVKVWGTVNASSVAKEIGNVGAAAPEEPITGQVTDWPMWKVSESVCEGGGQWGAPEITVPWEVDGSEATRWDCEDSPFVLTPSMNCGENPAESGNYKAVGTARGIGITCVGGAEPDEPTVYGEGPTMPIGDCECP